MTTSHVSPIPMACNLEALTADERAQRAALAYRLRVSTQEVVETETGYTLRLPAEPSACQEAFALALLERRCCPFLRLEIILEPGCGPVWLSLGGGPGVKAFLAASGLVREPGAEAQKHAVHAQQSAFCTET
jgi:hypothetical protein